MTTKLDIWKLVYIMSVMLSGPQLGFFFFGCVCVCGCGGGGGADIFFERTSAECASQSKEVAHLISQYQ